MSNAVDRSCLSVIQESPEELALQPNLKRVRGLPEKYFPYVRKPASSDYVDRYGRNVEQGRLGHCGSCQRNFSSVKEINGEYLCEFCEPVEEEQQPIIEVLNSRVLPGLSP